MEKIILHIDFDSFFASVEQQCNPSLRNRPVGVTAAHSRTAIIAASREAKRFGVRGGSNAREGLQLCPHLILIPAHFVQYFEVSKKFLIICKRYSPFIEVFSIDELFMDVTQTASLFGGVDSLMQHLKEDIAKEIGAYITVSIGVSHNKMLAKMASGLDKPNGITKITRENIDEIYRKAALTDVCGIGWAISERLMRMGIRTLLHLRAVPFTTLVAEFGPHEAQFLQNVAYAKDETEVVSFGKALTTKSVGRNYALPNNEYDKTKILQTIFELCEEVTLKLRRLEKKTRLVGMFLRGNTNTGVRKTIPFYLDTGKEMFYALLGETPKLSENLSYVRQVSVWAASLEDASCVTRSLFDVSGQKEYLTKAIDTLNEKFGDHTIRNGFLLTAPKLTTVPNGFLADRWDRLQLAKSY